MKKLKKNHAKEIVIRVKTTSIDDFFSHGKSIAKKLDKGLSIPQERIISFEDPKDLVRFLNEAKLELLAEVRKHPATITRLSQKLHRSRAALDKDIKLLESVGIVKSEYIANAGHGRHRIIKTVDSAPIRLQVEAVI